MMAVTFRRFMCVPEATHKSEAELGFRLRAVQLQTRHAAFLEAQWEPRSFLPFSLPKWGCQRAGRWGILWRSKGVVNAEMKPWREHPSLIHRWIRASASYTRPETGCGPSVASAWNRGGCRGTRGEGRLGLALIQTVTFTPQVSQNGPRPHKCIHTGLSSQFLD